MASEHIVKSYDEELKQLTETVARMGGLAEKQLAESIQSVVRRDPKLAARVVEADVRVDELEQEIDAFVVRLLALRQPMASDLREILAAFKTASDIERIADYATNIAKRALALVQTSPVKPVHAIPRMSKLTQTMIRKVLDAFVSRDAEAAVEVWGADEEVDEMYTSLFRELLTYMMEDARSITPCTHLLFIAKNIERIGDHATNIAETIYFLVHGSPILEERPKGDTSPMAVVEPVAATPKRKGKSS
jgi:phosphate transport system protein